MTRKKYEDPSVRQWFIELDAIVRHEILHHIITRRSFKEEGCDLDGLYFQSISLLQSQMEASCLYLDSLCEINDDIELVDLETSVGSLAAQHQVERFLDERDFMLQVIEKREFSELSSTASDTLISKYPLALRTIKFLVSSIYEQPFPSCLWSEKLNENFRVISLLESNNLEDIISFHAQLIKKLDHDDFDIDWMEKNKPDFIVSNKKYEYIDIQIIEKGDELKLVSIYKISKLLKLDEKHRASIVSYCEELLKCYFEHYCFNNNQPVSLLESDSLPIPPPDEVLSKKDDGYLALLFGLYCKKNESLYRVVNDDEFSVIFKSFNSFIRDDICEKFGCIDMFYHQWLNKLNNKMEVGDRETYISKVLPKRLARNMERIEKIIEDFESIYF